MKKLLTAVFVLSLLTTFYTHAKGPVYPEYGPKNEIFEQNNKYGLRNVATKKITLPAIYDTITTEMFSIGILKDRGLFEESYKFSKDGQNGLFSDALSKVILPLGPYTKFGYDYYKKEVPHIKVVSESGDEFILTDGGVKLNVYVEETLVEDVAYTFEPKGACFTPKLYKGFIISKNDKLGYMDKFGKMIISPKYDAWVRSDIEYGIRKIYDRLIFKNYNKANTGFTLYVYSLNGSLLASKFFYNDQSLAIRKFLQRYF